MGPVVGDKPPVAASTPTRSAGNALAMQSIPLIFVACLGLFLPAATAQESFESLLRQGFELHQRRQYAQAIPLLERAHRLRPKDYFANLLLGIDYLRSGNAAKALPFLDTASQAKPKDATPLGYSAEAHSALGRLDLAVGALHAAKQRDPSPQWRGALIRLYLARFRKISQQLRTTRRGLARSYRLQAQVLRHSKDPRERDVLHRAYSLSPDSDGIASALAHAEIRQQRFGSARQFVQEARQRNPHDLDMIAGEAYLAAQQGDWPAAEAKLHELSRRSRHRLRLALAEWPDSVEQQEELLQAFDQVGASTPPEPSSAGDVRQLFVSQRWEAVTTRVSAGAAGQEELFWLGVAQARLKRFEDAVAPLERARVDIQHQAEADYWLALSYARLAEEETAALSRGQAAQPILHAVKGEILLRLAGNGAAAVAEYKKAVALKAGDPALWAGLAAAELAAGDWENARESALKAIELDPGRVLASRTFAEVCMQERDYGAAIPALEKVLRLQPADIGAQFLLGTAYSQIGEYGKALEFLRKAERQGFPDEKGRLQYLLGTVLRKLGRQDEAQAALHRSQDIADAFAQTGHELSQPPADNTAK